MEQFELLAALFSLIIAGFVFAKIGIFKVEVSSILNKFLFYAAVPAAIIVSLAATERADLALFPRFIIANSLIYFLLIFLTYFLLRKIVKEYKSWGSLITTFFEGNVVFFGFPIILSLFGEQHLQFAVIFTVTALTVVDVCLIFLLELNDSQRKTSLKSQFKELIFNPLILSSIIGFAAMIFEVKLPAFLESGLDSVAGTITPVALFSLGIFATYNLSFSNLKFSLVAGVFKLLLLPAIVFAATYYLFRLDQLAVESSVIMAAMPAAIFNLILADTYNLDRKTSMNTIMLTSLAMFVTLPLWVYLLEQVF